MKKKNATTFNDQHITKHKPNQLKNMVTDCGNEKMTNVCKNILL